ncbi:bifunctional metallophosphatase/5'-nucleotidase [Thalassobacillus pellis]|uniref:bifunctional metallophosphatase/5'-nucleotidase n=1 Tax=Thalassobacillus pellis TaxID=748008 RepID=UPI00195F62A3|nr:bifunctional UDP-sugar hydrolase/5'-nucleotidase [Thalassobacillus pellis]MBM7554895.1 2',3'-cyclic-nucleotide 2'-phosphodiesterase (5'-nucleotidase family) [Thalassobacillus pellis]
MKEKIFFYYTNDLHSHFENWPQIVGYFKQEKTKREKNGQSYWVVDNGDHVDRFHPLTEGLMGKGNVQLLNEAGYHFANLGNNEGITLSREGLFELYDEAAFDVLCANLAFEKEPQPSWLQSSKVVKTVHGVKIGLIGLTAPFQAFYSLLGWEVESPFDTLERELPKLKNKTDVIVLLSHLGINDDEEIARRFKGIDVIIGGHTHHLFRHGEYINNTLLTAAGKYGTHLGEVFLEWDHTENRLTKKEAYAIPTENMAKDLDTAQSIKGIDYEAQKYLQEKITYLEHEQQIGWFQESQLMKELVQTLQDWTNAEIAMLNAGVLLDSLKEGEVCYADVHRICPHPMNPCKVELTGDELLEVIRASYTKEFTEIKLKGFGFRGEVIGRMVYTGLDIVTTVDQSGTERVKSVLYQGNPLEADKTYQVATADTFTFGRLLPEIAYSKKKKYYMPELLRDLLVETLKRT